MQHAEENPGIHEESLERKRCEERLLGAELVSPVLTLPPEITSEIFQCSLDFEGPWDHPSPTTAPMLFLQICGLWRAIAISTPLLWTRLTVVFGFVHFGPGDLSDRWLSRACDAPLSLQLYGSSGDNSVILLLRRHASHLHHLRIRMHNNTSSEIKDIGPLPALRSLSVGEFGLTDCRNVLRDSPLLEECAFSRVAHEPNADSAIITNAALQKLKITDGGADVLQFLRLPVLRELSLISVLFHAPPLQFLARATALHTFIYDASHFPEDEDAFSLPWLRAMSGLAVLKLTDVADEIADALFYSLDRERDAAFLPHLRSLEMVSMEHYVDEPVVVSLSSRSPAAKAIPGKAALASLRLISYRQNYTPSWDEMGDIDWEALWDLTQSPMDIYVGTVGFGRDGLGGDKRNYLREWGADSSA